MGGKARPTPTERGIVAPLERLSHSLGEISIHQFDSIRAERSIFLQRPDAGKPLSLLFLCEIFELDLTAVQTMARARMGQACKRYAMDLGCLGN